MNFTLFAILYVAAGLIVTILFLRLCEKFDGKLSDSSFSSGVLFLFVWPIGFVAIVIYFVYDYASRFLKNLYELIFKKEEEND